jgi:phytoene synthase
MSRTPLDDCFDKCEQLTKRTAGNFYYSFLGLPTPQYRAMCALYAFMRVTDDWGDDPSQSLAQRIEALETWRRSLIEVLRPDWSPLETSGWSEEARMVLPAMRDVAIRFAIPHEHLFAVIDGVRSDLGDVPKQLRRTGTPARRDSNDGEDRDSSDTQPMIDGQECPSYLAEPTCRFQTFEELNKYCYLVAGAVGLCCIHIWGFHGDDAVQRAIDCGTAFQLTNILRDVGEDADEGRIYLPAEDLARFGVTIEDLQAHRCDDRFRSLMAFEAERAKTFYASAEQLLTNLEPLGQPIMKAMLQLYGGLLHEIERSKFDVFSRRVSLPRWRKLWIAADALIHQKLRRS